MSWLVAIIVGIIVGYLAGVIMRTEAEQGLLTNIVVGVIGALLGKALFFNLLKIGSAAAAGTFSFWGIFWGVIGAVILIAILRGLRVLY